jgi:hypothetical protein
MIRKVAVVWVLVALFVPAPWSLAAPRGTAEADPRAFVETMLTGIGAEERQCAPEIVEQVRAREMHVVCASFEGSFERFELRWGLQISRNELIKGLTPEDPKPVAVPQTGWEAAGPVHERIYVVGRKAIGVRFTAGELLMVW